MKQLEKTREFIFEEDELTKKQGTEKITDMLGDLNFLESEFCLKGNAAQEAMDTTKNLRKLLYNLSLDVTAIEYSGED